MKLGKKLRIMLRILPSWNFSISNSLIKFSIFQRYKLDFDQKVKNIHHDTKLHHSYKKKCVYFSAMVISYSKSSFFKHLLSRGLSMTLKLKMKKKQNKCQEKWAWNFYIKIKIKNGLINQAYQSYV